MSPEAERFAERFAALPDGGRLAYAVLGEPREAPPILLLRPIGGTMTLWGELATRLATAYQIIPFDPRGVGRSSDVPLGHTTRSMARDAVALLDVLGVARAHVFGLSLGGMAASWLAIDARERVDRLVLASTLPRAGAISSRIFRHTLGFLRWFTRRGVTAEVGLLHEILSSTFKREHPERVEELERLVRGQPAKLRNLVLLAFAAAEHNAEPELGRIRAPTLLMFGEWDPIAGMVSEAELESYLPYARLAIIRRSGHDISLEQPAATADAILEFLRAPARRASESSTRP